MVRALPVLLLLLSAACGLAEDERDEKNRYIYLTFYDKAFEAWANSTSMATAASRATRRSVSARWSVRNGASRRSPT